MGWALLGASSLLLGALVAFAVPIPRKVLGFILAFGAGVLISAVAYELVEEAVTVAADWYAVAIGFPLGALVFFLGDVAIDLRLKGSSGGGGGLGIVLGAVLDGIPESVVIGASLLTGETASVAVIVAVFLSNIPESISASSDLLRGGWSRWKVLLLWVIVVAASTLAAGLGYVALEGASGSWIAADPGVRGGRDPDDARGRDDPRGVRVHRAQQDRRPGAGVRVRAVGRALVRELGHPGAGHHVRRLVAPGMARHREQERLAFEREEAQRCLRDDRGGPRDVAEQGDLADVPPGPCSDTGSPARVISTLPSTIT